jgi:hypothetical protein
MKKKLRGSVFYSSFFPGQVRLILKRIFYNACPAFQTKKVGKLMVNLNSLKIQRPSLASSIKLLFLVFFFCPNLWASQMAMVLADKAIIYSDLEMSSPIGYVRRGKKLTVGEIPRNKAQVYPIEVSGKIAYIRVLDVTTEKESMDSDRLVAERFQKSTVPVFRSKFVLSYYRFNSEISLTKNDSTLTDGDAYAWNGVSLKGEILRKNSWDIQILTNYMVAQKDNGKFAALELGMGTAYRLIDNRKLILRAEAQFLAIPFSTFSYKDDFRIKSYGFTVGAGVNSTYLFNENWGVEGYFGFYQTKLSGFDAPKPYKDFAATFIGSRLGIGLNYSY